MIGSCLASRSRASSRASKSLWGLWSGEFCFFQVDPANATALQPMSAAGVLYENPTHGLSRGCKKCPASIPGPVRLATDQSQVRFVDERGRLESLTRHLSQPLCGEPPQLVVDERQQLTSGAGLALNAL